MTLRIRGSCLCLHTQRAARAIACRFDETLRPVGLRSGQYSILISLNRPESPTVGSVADLLAMDRTTLTANIKPLELRGLLTVTHDTKDRRARRLSLTDDGPALLEQAIAIWIATHDEIERGLDGNVDALRDELNLLTTFTDAEPEKTVANNAKSCWKRRCTTRLIGRRQRITV